MLLPCTKPEIVDHNAKLQRIDLVARYVALFHRVLTSGRVVALALPRLGELDDRKALVLVVSGLVRLGELLEARMDELGHPLERTRWPQREFRTLATSLANDITGNIEIDAVLYWVSQKLAPSAFVFVQTSVDRLYGEVNWADAAMLQSIGDLVQDITAATKQIERPIVELCSKWDELLPNEGCAYQLDDETDGVGVFDLVARGPSKRVYPSGSRFTTEPVKLQKGFQNDLELRRFMHDNIQIELIATDIPMLNLAQTPGMPMQFYADMARHAVDEIFHVEMLMHEMVALGGRIGEFPFESGDRYDVLVDMAIVPRLVLLSRTGEAEAIEGILNIISSLRNLGREDLARAFEYVRFDEIRHVRLANRWLRYLLGPSEIEPASNKAIESYNLMIVERSVPKSLRSINYLDQVRPSGIDAEGRLLAGFTDAEVNRMSRT